MSFAELKNRIANMEAKVINACAPEEVVIMDHAIYLTGKATAQRIACLYALGIDLKHKDGSEYYTATVTDDMFIKLKA